MHRDDADGVAGPRGGRGGRDRAGERPGRTAPARRRPAPGPSLRGIHVSPCQTARAGASPGGVRRPGQPADPYGANRSSRGKSCRDQGSRQARRSEEDQGINALGISRQLLAQLLNRDPLLLLLLQGGIDRIDPLQALLDRGDHLLLQQGEVRRGRSDGTDPSPALIGVINGAGRLKSLISSEASLALARDGSPARTAPGWPETAAAADRDRLQRAFVGGRCTPVASH